MRGDQKRGGQVAAELLKKHEWIHTERALFGQAGGDYDFGARNFREAEEELKAKQTEQHGYGYYPPPSLSSTPGNAMVVPSSNMAGAVYLDTGIGAGMLSG